MKKNLMSLAVAGTVAAAASTAIAQTQEDTAMYINDRLTGEALVIPMYSAQNGNNTYFQLVNTYNQHKAVKVRMVEAWNSREVLDFNVYMSPKDHFSFNIKVDGEGAKLVTVDNTCTVPEIPKVDADDVTPPIKREVAFRNTKYAGDKGGTGATAYDNTGEFREQIGYIEVIEMGQINPKAAPSVDKAGSLSSKMTVAAAITHGADGVPADCGVPVQGWSTPNNVPGQWLADIAAGTGKTARGSSEFFTNWQGGGLYAYATILNIGEGTAIGQDAVALANYAADGEAGWAMHYKPGDTEPSFNDPSVNPNVLVTGNETDGGSPDLLTFTTPTVHPYYMPVSAAFMASNVMNDYVVDPGIAADTDWVLTFPTKFFHVEKTVVVDPFSVTWSGSTACEPSTLTVYDREEAAKEQPSFFPDFSPAPEEQEDKKDLQLCYELTVLQFGDDSALNVTGVATGVGSILGDYTEGWADLNISESGVTDTYSIAFDRVIDPTTGPSLEGLPVTGFAAISYVNSDANEAGALANYSSATEHKTRVISS